MTTSNSWFVRVRLGMSVKGLMGHKCDPIANGKTWTNGVCTHCHNPLGVLFVSRTDNKVQFVLCPKCNKFTKIEAASSAPSEKSAANASVVDQCEAIKKSTGKRCSLAAHQDGLCKLHHNFLTGGATITRVNVKGA